MPLISGRISDAMGNPVAGARVMVTDGPVPVPDVALLTDRDGDFAHSVPVAGRWQLLAATDDARGRADVTIEPGETAAHCTLILSPD